MESSNEGSDELPVRGVAKLIMDMVNDSPTEAHLDHVDVRPGGAIWKTHWAVRAKGKCSPHELAIATVCSISTSGPIKLYLNDRVVDMTDFNVVD